MPGTVGPTQVVADREDDMTGLAINAQDVDDISLFDGHLPFYTEDTACRSSFGCADSSRRVTESSILFSFETDFTGG